MAFRRYRKKRSTRRMRRPSTFKRRSFRKRTRGFGRGKRTFKRKSAAEKPVAFKFQIRKPIQFALNGGGTANIVVDSTSTFPQYGNISFSLLDIPQDKRLAWEDLYREVKLSGVRVQWMPPGQQTNMTIPWTNAGTETNAILPAQRATMYWLKTNQLFETDEASMGSPWVAEPADTLLQYGGVKKWMSASRIKSTYFKAMLGQARDLGTGPAAGTVTVTSRMPHPYLPTGTVAKAGGTGAAPPAYGISYAFDNFGQTANVFNLTGNVPATTDPLDPASVCNYGHFVFTYYVTCRKSRPFVPVPAMAQVIDSTLPAGRAQRGAPAPPDGPAVGGPCISCASPAG